MKIATVEALDRINQRFYSASASNFHQTRFGPWKGWSRLLASIESASPQRLRVLDVGCGNARFASYLSRSLPNLALTYVGLDSSLELLARARATLDPLHCAFELREINLLGDDYRGCASLLGTQQPFDLVVAFGVLHHVPGCLQIALLNRCLEACDTTGKMCASFWQFGAQQRFQNRRLPWTWAEAHGLLTNEQIAELDTNDWLLPWGEKHQGLARYCRFNTPDAVISLLETVAPTTTPETFQADGASGDLNFYALLTKSG